MKKIKIESLLRLIVISSVVIIGSFFTLNAAKQPKDLELHRREAAYSEQIQFQLKQTLSEYYKSDVFLVNVKSYLERIPEKVDVQQSQSYPVESSPLPGLPVSPSMGNSMQMARQYTNEQWLFSDNFKVKYVEISVLVNKDLFSKEDIAFIQRIVKMNTAVDAMRGDRVSIVPLAFPVSTKAKKESSSGLSVLFNEQTKYVWMAAGILLLLLILTLIALLTSMKKHKKPSYMLDGYGANDKPALPQNQQEDLLSSPKTLELPMSNAGALGTKVNDDENTTALFYELRQLMVTTLIGNPEMSSEIFRKWVDVDSDDGIYKLAAFMKATDPKLTEILSEHLGKEITAKVEFAMHQIQDIDKDSLSEVFKKFREEFQNEQSARLLKGDDDTEKGDMFHFLKSLTPHHIFQLIKDEPIGIIAVVLAQISPEAANEVINNLPQDYQQKIPVEIGKLKKIPVSAYKDIARKLSKKAMELEKIKFVSTDGISTLVDMLEQSSPEMEERLLASVAEHDIALAEELRKVYITFDELVKLPDRILADVIRDFDRAVIVTALINANEEVASKILDVLPPRTKIMVADKLESMQEEMPAEDISSARHIITKKIRDMAKSGKIDLKKYLS
jgi:flagellar motor switch protein FliG